jgi:hypothetical protein
MPREKKNACPAPISPKFVLDAAILARKRGRGGKDENPVAVQLMPPDQSHARLEVSTSIEDLDLCRPALTERYHTPHPSLPFRLVTLNPCPFIYYGPLLCSAYNTSSFSPHRPLSSSLQFKFLPLTHGTII